MAFWIDVRWPPIPEDRLDLLYFHEGQCRMAHQMRRGDSVLYYETLGRPGSNLRGSQTVFAYVIVRGELECRRPPVESGGYTWDRIRRVEVVLPENEDMKHRGVRLPRVLKVLSWKPNARLRRGIRITEEQFRKLAAELKRGMERARGAAGTVGLDP